MASCDAVWGTEASDLCSASHPPSSRTLPNTWSLEGIASQVWVTELVNDYHLSTKVSSVLQLHPALGSFLLHPETPVIFSCPHLTCCLLTGPRRKGAAGTISYLWELRCCLIFRFPLSLSYVSPEAPQLFSRPLGGSLESSNVPAAEPGVVAWLHLK